MIIWCAMDAAGATCKPTGPGERRGAPDGGAHAWTLWPATGVTGVQSLRRYALDAYVARPLDHQLCKHRHVSK